jgi:hypothetical protein
MIINRTTKRAQDVLDNAHNVRCFSLDNYFNGEPLAEKPVIWGVALPGENHRPLVEVSPIGFLRHKLESKSTKLIDNGNGFYTIHVHGNLWYTFQS